MTCHIVLLWESGLNLASAVGMPTPSTARRANPQPAWHGQPTEYASSPSQIGDLAGHRRCAASIRVQPDFSLRLRLGARASFIRDVLLFHLEKQTISLALEI